MLEEINKWRTTRPIYLEVSGSSRSFIFFWLSYSYFTSCCFLKNQQLKQLRLSNSSNHKFKFSPNQLHRLFLRLLRPLMSSRPSLKATEKRPRHQHKLSSLLRLLEAIKINNLLLRRQQQQQRRLQRLPARLSTSLNRPITAIDSLNKTTHRNTPT